MAAAGTLLVLVGLVVGMGFYFIPSIVASAGKHHNAGAIFALNLLLGWTLVGWVIALVWALTVPPQAAGLRICPSCRGAVAATFLHCPQCGVAFQAPPSISGTAAAPATVAAPSLQLRSPRWRKGVRLTFGLIVLVSLLSVVTMMIVAMVGKQRLSSQAVIAPCPVFTEVHAQGIAYIIVVTPEVATSQRDLWVIAEELRDKYQPKNGTIQVMFWTSRSTAAERLPMSDLAMITQVAQVNLNPLTGLRELVALNGHRFTR